MIYLWCRHPMPLVKADVVDSMLAMNVEETAVRSSCGEFFSHRGVQSMQFRFLLLFG
jgi:hypothetical protein